MSGDMAFLDVDRILDSAIVEASLAPSPTASSGAETGYLDLGLLEGGLARALAEAEAAIKALGEAAARAEQECAAASEAHGLAVDRLELEAAEVGVTHAALGEQCAGAGLRAWTLGSELSRCEARRSRAQEAADLLAQLARFEAVAAAASKAVGGGAVSEGKECAATRRKLRRAMPELVTAEDPEACSAIAKRLCALRSITAAPLTEKMPGLEPAANAIQVACRVAEHRLLRRFAQEWTRA
eukprot:CAMPEP_0172654450 /NCGR_PEP_ID=MMETSP1068-20121228/244341_1 /TAXON_ID=35684 /ORGANISM="Pseudopedinella elastica, Strain CCMP716" /LENGTH=240 /DNA_ID=CAMNT_0013468895 /DNA_START=115 /DNA_END=834 /DNA_ORIENTATION=+